MVLGFRFSGLGLWGILLPSTFRFGAGPGSALNVASTLTVTTSY